jgi:hypothetical protein
MAKRPSQMPKDMDRFLNRVVAETVITMQSELGSTKVSPYDTGRFRSSWFAAEGVPSSAMASEGTDSPSTNAMGLKMDWRREFHLTNNLPYAQAVAIEGKVVSQPTTWFADFLNSRVPKIVDAAAKVAKAEFDR